MNILQRSLEEKITFPNSMDDSNCDMNEEHFLCDVILIAGFLGAGKTTLLKNILEWPGDLSSTAVLVNEFGKIGIDGELLQGFDTQVVQLTNGCICCTVKGDFLKTVQEILDKFHPSRLFIEATGVADPFEVLDLFRSNRLKERTNAIKVITVIDGDLWEGRDYFGPLFYNQIIAAELILFNKVDLLSKKDVPKNLQEIREINPSCSLVPTYHCYIDPEVLWKTSIKMDHEPELHFPFVNIDQKNAEEIGYVTFSFEDSVPFRMGCFHKFVEALPARLYRLKGFALLEDNLFLVNHVGGKTDWKELDKKGTTSLTFVGWRVSEDQIIEDLKVCLKHDNK